MQLKSSTKKRTLIFTFPIRWKTDNSWLIRGEAKYSSSVKIWKVYNQKVIRRLNLKEGKDLWDSFKGDGERFCEGR